MTDEMEASKIAELNSKIEFSYAVCRMVCELALYMSIAIAAYFITRIVAERVTVKIS